MAGWFEAFAQMAGGLGKGLDRYTALRRMDEESQFKREMERLEAGQRQQQIDLQRQQQQRLQDQLDRALMKQDRMEFLETFGPGSQLDEATMGRADQLGFGPLVERGTHTNPLQQLGGSFNLPGKSLLLPDQYDPTQSDAVLETDPMTMQGGYRLPEQPTRSNVFSGTYEQQLNQLKMMQPIMERNMMLSAVQNGDPRNLQFNALMTALTNGQYDVRKVVPSTGTQNELSRYLNSSPEEREALLSGIKAIANARHIPGQNEAVDGLTPDAIQMLGDMFATTGTMAPFGMGGMGQRNAIYNAAANTWQGQGGASGFIAGNKAAYNADQSSLRSLQQTVDMMVGFEKAAEKNLAVFDGLTKQLSDTGSPILNAPVRWLQQNAQGDATVAKAMAARQIALREIARITNNPRLTGQLTDDARHEVSSLVPESATLAQIAGVLSVLRQDLQNVRSSMEAQRDGIINRINTIGQSPTAGGSSTIRVLTGKTLPNGQPEILEIPASMEQQAVAAGGKVIR